MVGSSRISLDSSTLLAYQKQYHTQKRLADALFGLFRTMGSALHVERVANIGLLTLTGQLLIKCAAFFKRDSDGNYSLLSTVGARDSRLGELVLQGSLAPLVRLFRERGVLDLQEDHNLSDASMRHLSEHGFCTLFPLADGHEPLGLIALGTKIVPGPLTAEDLQILDAFGVVISVSLKNSLAFELVEESRNELERLNEMKSEFLNHVSHEFRTPLTILKTALEMVEMDPEILVMQQSALARLERLVNSVLLLNEINSHGVQLERILVNSRDWVSQHVRPLIRPEGSFELVDELPDCTLEFDLFKISNALENHIENAVKFGNSKGTISLYLNSRSAVIAALESDSGEVKAIERGYLRPERPLKGASRNTMLVIEVLDDGIGIPTHEKQAIFQPFTQAANSPTRGVRGAGLGLAMAKRIVDAHGGEIFCRSAMEQGTAFYIAIPIAWQRSG
jgi:two-component system sensor histidine kinase VicK